jgi:secernin
MWFAKNSDRHPDEPQVVEWHARRRGGRDLHTQYLSIEDADAFAFCGSRPTWLWGCEHGVNEHGVAIGNEKIWTTTRPRDLPPALLGMDLVRLVLERARSADEALDICTSLLERHGQGGSGEPHADEPYFSSFLVADASAGWVIETSNRTWVARPVDAGTSISNRVSMATDWTRASQDITAGLDFDRYRLAAMPTSVADHRLATTRACVSAHEIDARHIARTLRDHSDGDSGFSVCMHRSDVHAQTTASMIVDLRADDAPLRAWVCLGNPCVGVYLPVFPPAIAPELAEVAQWQRFSALRDRDMAEVRAVLQPVEDELWAAADDAFAAGSRDALAFVAQEAYKPVDDALRRLGV